MGETLRPNGAGAETALTPYPNSGEANWEDVDDVSPDDPTTYVKARAEWQRDLYALPDLSSSGAITSVTVYFRVNGTASIQAKPVIRSWDSVNSVFVVTEGTGVTLTANWVTFSQEWTTNPADNQGWETSDLQGSHKIQVGVGLGIGGSKVYAYCTQIYAYVNFIIVKIGNETLGIKDGSEEQLKTSEVWPMNSSGRTRTAQKLTIPNQEITNLAFLVHKVNSPTGDITLRIRKVSDDSILASKYWGDASSLPDMTWVAWVESNITPTVVNGEVRFCLEYSNGDATNRVNVWMGYPNPKPNEQASMYIDGDWNDTVRANYDLVYRYQYTQSIIKVILKAIGARIINIGRFGITIFRAGRE